MMNCAGQSKSSDNDSIWVSVKSARNLVIAAQQKAVLEEQVEILNQRIQGKESIIRALHGKDSINQALSVSYQKELQIMREQRGIFETELKAVNKQLKRERRKTRLVALAGIITTAAGIFFIK
jgi:hypothetical protein